MLEKDFIKSSLSSSYYSVFHAARTLLVFKKLDSKKHSGVIALFNQEYIKTNLVEEKAKDILTKAFYVRIESDYKDFYLATQKEAEEQIKNAEYFLNEIVSFIKHHYKVDI